MLTTSLRYRKLKSRCASHVENHGLLVIVVTGRLQYHALICSHEFLWIGSGDATWPIYDGKICLVGNTTVVAETGTQEISLLELSEAEKQANRILHPRQSLL